MKKLIYLSLVAGIVLSGCKGNSFMTQRYTKFGHASHKTIRSEKEVVKTKTAVAPENIVETECVIGESKFISANSTGITENVIIPDERISMFPIANSNTKLETENPEHVKIITKKTSEQKKQVAKRIIGTLLKIVLWVIILAVVVGVLLIIGALA